MYENMADTSCRWLRRDDDPENDGSFKYTEQLPALTCVFTVQRQMVVTDSAGRDIGVDATAMLFQEISADDRLVIADVEYEIVKLHPLPDLISMVSSYYLAYLKQRGTYSAQSTSISQVTTRG